MNDAQTRMQAAYNEFVADFVERHERVPSTRDEAHDVADKIVAMGREVATLCKKYARSHEAAEEAAETLAEALVDEMDDASDGHCLAGWAVAVALESPK